MAFGFLLLSETLARLDRLVDTGRVCELDDGEALFYEAVVATPAVSNIRSVEKD